MSAPAIDVCRRGFERVLKRSESGNQRGQDKSVWPFDSQAPVRTWFSPCRSVGRSAARGTLFSVYNRLFGTVPPLLRLGTIR